jgi:hypothetical protein
MREGGRQMAQFDRQGIALHDLFWRPPAFGPIF